MWVLFKSELYICFGCPPEAPSPGFCYRGVRDVFESIMKISKYVHLSELNKAMYRPCTVLNQVRIIDLFWLPSGCPLLRLLLQGGLICN